MINVSAQEIRQCYDFACFAWNNGSQSGKQFGTQEVRSREAFIADQVTGKIAEIIFKKQIEQTFSNVKVHLDFQHYLNPLHTDQGDVVIYIDNQFIPLKLDIKSSSHRAYWLLVENHKYIDLSTYQKISDRYVMVKFSSNMPINKSLRKNPEQILNLKYVSGEIAGWATHEQFRCPQVNVPWFEYRRGERLINTRYIPNVYTFNINKYGLDTHLNSISDIQKRAGEPLDAEVNYGLPIAWLNNDFNMLLTL